MTKKQREQVVKLLRCAADYGPEGAFGCNGIGAASRWLSLDDSLWFIAVDARRSVDHDGRADYAYSCLEAARRVEEGTWP